MNIWEIGFAASIVFIFITSVVVIKGNTIWDRLLGLNVIASEILIGIIFYALMTDLNYLFDIAFLYSLIGLLGVVLFSRFVKKKGSL
jgi:multicomponent Na+:H+ antiporter subunit F